MNHSTFQRSALFAAMMGAGAMLASNAVVAQGNIASLGIEEMVVTAQKREENLQAVPISISSLSANDIERRGLTNGKDLIATIPNAGGFEPPGGKGNMSLTMRGVSAGAPSNLSLDTSTAIYVDGILMGKMVGAATDVAELERVEVLRGPQGTLYGRNATGGAVNFITRKPTGEFGGKISGTAGNKNLWSVRATVDTPTLGTEGEGLGTVKATFGAQTRKRDGFQKNTTAVQSDFDDLDRQAWRGLVRWEPTDSVTVDYAFDRSKLDENAVMQSLVGLTPVGLNFNPANGPIGAPIDRLAALNGYIQAAQGAAFGLGPLATAYANDPTFARWANSVVQTRDAMSDLNRPGNRPSRGAVDKRSGTTNDVKGHSLTVAWQFDDLGMLGDVEFKSMTGWRKIKSHNFGDLDAINNTIVPGGAGALNDSALGAMYQLYAAQTPGNTAFLQPGMAKLWNLIDQFGGDGFTQDARSDFRQFSEELQMVGSTERLQYAVGLYYYDDKGKFDNYRLAAVPVGGILSTAYTNDTKAEAFYSQFTYTPDMLEDRLSFTVGYRFTKETKKILFRYLDDGVSAGQGIFLPNGSINLGYTGDLSPAPNYGQHFKKDFRNNSGAITLAYQITDDTNVFVRYSTGYRSGGYNGEVWTPSKPNNPFKEETIKQWEIGVKSDIVPGTLRLNASIFQFTIDDMQVSQIETNARGQLTSFITNAGETDRWGTELEVQWSPTDNLLVSASWAHMDGDFEKFPALCGSGIHANVCIDAKKYATRAQAADDQLSLVTDWVFASTDWADFMAHLEIFWQDKTYAAATWSTTYPDRTGGSVQGAYPYMYAPVVMNARTLVNARIGMENFEFSNGTSLRASLWVRNAFDKKYSTFGINMGTLGVITDQYGEPRTYGLDLIWEF